MNQSCRNDTWSLACKWSTVDSWLRHLRTHNEKVYWIGILKFTLMHHLWTRYLYWFCLFLKVVLVMPRADNSFYYSIPVTNRFSLEAATYVWIGCSGIIRILKMRGKAKLWHNEGQSTYDIMIDAAGKNCYWKKNVLLLPITSKHLSNNAGTSEMQP